MVLFKPVCSYLSVAHRLVAIAAVAVTPALVLAQSAEFHPLPFLSSGRGARGSWAYGVNPSGTIIAGASLLPGGASVEHRAALWQFPNGGVPSGAEALQGDPSIGSAALAVSEDGRRVVGSIGLFLDYSGGPSYSPMWGSYWWGRGTPGAESAMVPGTMEFSDITADGSLAVGTLRDPTYWEPMPFKAIVWTGPGAPVQRLPDFGGIALGSTCSRDGAVIVGAGLNLDAPAPIPGEGVINALYWDELGPSPIPGFDPAEWHEAHGVSGNGQWITGPMSLGSWRWSAATGITVVPNLPGSGWSTAAQVSDDGSIVIGESVTDTDTGREHDAFIWRSGRGTRRLADELIDRGIDLAGWRLLDAKAMSDDGAVIVGFAVNPEGERQGFAVRLSGAAPCPCPADFDASGGTPDSTDITAFFAAWLEGESRADTDCSAGTPDLTDIELFFGAWLAGGC